MTIRFSQFVATEGARNLSGKLRPSGRFSFAQVFAKKKKVLNNDKYQEKIPQEVRPLSELDDTYAKLIGGDFSPLRELPPSSPGNGGALGSSIANNSRIRSPRGSKGISASARDVLCWSANQLEHVYTRRCMSFATLTLPELSGVDLVAVQSEWPRIVKDTQEEIKRELSRHGIQTSIVGCTELQLERGERDGKCWPHLHMVFRGRRDTHSVWELTTGRLREIWRGVINRVVPSGAYDWSASENLQPVRKSCGGYLAKYISKNKSKGASEVRDNWHPSDWIVCSRRLRGLYKTLSVTGYDIAQTLSNVCVNWVHGMGYKQPIVISTPAYGDRIIGQWGWLKGEAVFLGVNEWYALV